MLAAERWNRERLAPPRTSIAPGPNCLTHGIVHKLRIVYGIPDNFYPQIPWSCSQYRFSRTPNCPHGRPRWA